MAEETTPNVDPQTPDETAAEDKPAQAKPAPTEAEDKPAQAKPAPTEAEGKPAKAKPAPTEAEDKPAQAKPAPTEAEGKPAKAKPAATDGKPAPGKKPKEPALEDKPFTEFMQQHFTPALKEALAKEGLKDIEVDFTKDKLPIAGLTPNEQYWQVKGNWLNGKRQFNLYFLDENINGQKAFSYTTNSTQPSTIESFMIDERKVTLDLMLRYTLQRLNGQKWLHRN